MLQKLKIARRKGKADKVERYETRLTELGVEFPKGVEKEEGEENGEEGADGKEGEGDAEKKATENKDKEKEKGTKDKVGKKGKQNEKEQEQKEEQGKGKDDNSTAAPSVQAGSAELSAAEPVSASHSQAPSESSTTSAPPPADSTPAPDTEAVPTPPSVTDSKPLATLNPCVTSLTVTLAASQKTKILIELRQTSQRPSSVEKAASSRTRTMKSSIKVHDRKNTDDTVCVNVVATLAGRVEEVKKGKEGAEGDGGREAVSGE
jgi:hypothetical protein